MGSGFNKYCLMAPQLLTWGNLQCQNFLSLQLVSQKLVAPLVLCGPFGQLYIDHFKSRDHNSQPYLIIFPEMRIQS